MRITASLVLAGSSFREGHVSDRYLYVADAVNRRVLRCRLTYTAEATCVNK